MTTPAKKRRSTSTASKTTGPARSASTTPSKKASPEAAARTAKQAGAKRPTSKKQASKKPASKKPAAKKATTRKSDARKPATKKATTKGPVAKKPASRTTVPGTTSTGTKTARRAPRRAAAGSNVASPASFASAAPAFASVADWLRATGREPFPFQAETWGAYATGESGLVHAATGMGKTLAAWGGALNEWLDAWRGEVAADTGTLPADGDPAPHLRVLWLTPLRALATDTAEALREPLDPLGIPWTVGVRTGDTPQSVKTKQRRRLPTALVTTPESLSLLLTYAGVRERFRHLRLIVVDEWHELMSSKRGVQAELCLARLRTLAPHVRTWGMSATLGNIDEALGTLVGAADVPARVVRGLEQRPVEVETLRPTDMERFPWSGHLGTRLLDATIDRIERGGTTLVFTNTRSQAEIWFQSIVGARPDWTGEVALHHGSLDRDLRAEVEDRVRRGDLKAVVCTSSLDLGVDFSPVDQVVQVGSPKGVGRLLQRAGRSGHRPGATSRVLGVPTNAFELVEFAAARRAIDAARVESRPAIAGALDVLCQHLVTVALGDGFEDAAMFDEVRRTRAFAGLTDTEWAWCLDFVTRGGTCLRAYPQFAKVAQRGDGVRVVESKQVARMHRMGVGTITSDGALVVRFKNGRSLGTIEESFISRLRPGDRFAFAGRALQLERVRDMTAIVRPARGRKGMVPRWGGGRSPLSTQLAAEVRRMLDEARSGRYEGPEMEAVAPILELQRAWSVIPAPDGLLIEEHESRDGHHAFIFTFAGRLVNEGLGPLLAHRIVRERASSITACGNDYGIELLGDEPFGPADGDGDDAEVGGGHRDAAGAARSHWWRRILAPDDLLDDLVTAMNQGELERRHFREIARVAGLVFQGYPGQPKSARQLQASSELFYDVFRDFDPENLLLQQARREVLERELEFRRMSDALERMAGERLTLVRPPRLTPMSFPLWADRIRTTQMTSASWTDRVQKMVAVLESAAG